MTQTTTKNAGSADGVGSQLLDTAKDILGGKGGEVVDRVKDLGKTNFERVRSFITAHPFECVGAGIGAGLIIRSLFRGPLLTLLMLGGAGYIGSRIAAK